MTPGLGDPWFGVPIQAPHCQRNPAIWLVWAVCQCSDLLPFLAFRICGFFDALARQAERVSGLHFKTNASWG